NSNACILLWRCRYRGSLIAAWGSPRLGALEQENDNGGVEPATLAPVVTEPETMSQSSGAILSQFFDSRSRRRIGTCVVQVVCGTSRRVDEHAHYVPTCRRLQEGFTGARAEQARSTRPR